MTERTSYDDFKSSYFVVKCATLEGLQKCISTGMWAYRKRAKSPQPQTILGKAHAENDSKVILIFSVNNQHGWHGYCESLFSLEPTESESSVKDNTGADDEWCYFSVKWISHFQSLNSYACLPSEKTKDLKLLDGSPVNQARNWQEMSDDVGHRMCLLIDQHFAEILDKRNALEQEKLEAIKAKESFFKEEELSLRDCEDVSFIWQSVIEKVEKDLGKVILACPFGSQRYNCSLPESDSDILLIYQAQTVDMLGLDQPQQTIKNSHSSRMDYTVLEMQRYCELLVAGDPRYVETLFIKDESIIAQASDSWKKLCDNKQHLLTQDCLEKYLREAKGTKGLKQFDKWKSELKDSNVPSQKMNKLAYIILRLLQSGRDIVKLGRINVYRKDDSEERQELLNARKGHFKVSDLCSLFDGYLVEIEKCRESACFSQPSKAKSIVQEWLIGERLHDIH